MDNIKHISFDLWLTLIRTNPSFKGVRAAMFRTFFELENHPPAKVEAAIRGVDVLVNNMNEITGRNVHTYEIYLLILHTLGRDVKSIDPAQLSAFYDLSEKLFFQFPPQPLYENMRDMLAALRTDGTTISVLSNTGFIQGPAMRKLMNILGWEEHFAFQLYSDETGYSKPSPEMFNRLITAASALHTPALTPEQIWHIGDNPLADVQGAEKAGLRASLTHHIDQPLDSIFYNALKN